MQFIVLYSSLQFRYGTHWAPIHPDDVDGQMTELLLDDMEVLTGIAARLGNVVDNMQFISNIRSFPRLGVDANFNAFISSTELRYFAGSEFRETVFGRLRVSGLIAMSSACSVE